MPALRPLRRQRGPGERRAAGPAGRGRDGPGGRGAEPAAQGGGPRRLLWVRSRPELRGEAAAGGVRAAAAGAGPVPAWTWERLGEGKRGRRMARKAGWRKMLRALGGFFNFFFYLENAASEASPGSCRWQPDAERTLLFQSVCRSSGTSQASRLPQVTFCQAE